MKILNYEVIEDNGGGLTLAVFKNGKCIWLHCDYEYHPSGLVECIDDIKAGVNPVLAGWEGCVEYPQRVYDEIMSWEAFNRRIVADSHGIYVDEMGCNAREAFGIKEEEF